MANVSEQAVWEDGITQIETQDDVVGGADGTPNIPNQELANRTQYLRKQMDADKQQLASHQKTENPHPQYLTQERGDERYQPKGEGNSGGGLNYYDLGLYSSNNILSMQPGDRAFRLIDGDAHLQELAVPVALGNDQLYKVSLTTEHEASGDNNLELKPNDQDYSGEFTTQFLGLKSGYSNEQVTHKSASNFLLQPWGSAEYMPLLFELTMATGKQGKRRKIINYQVGGKITTTTGTAVWHSIDRTWERFGTLRFPHSAAKFWHLVIERVN